MFNITDLVPKLRRARDQTNVETKLKYVRVAPQKQQQRRVKSLIITVLLAHILIDLIDNYKRPHDVSVSQIDKSLVRSTLRLTRGIIQVVVVAAAADSYSDATAESPTAEALEDDDEDDEELDTSASNEYPDGENDNDESYDDADGK